MRNKITTIITILIIITALIALTVTILTKPTPLIVTLFILLVVEGLVLYVYIENEYLYNFIPEGRSHSIDSIVITAIGYLNNIMHIAWKNSTSNGVIHLDLRNFSIYSHGVDDEFAKMIISKVVEQFNFEDNI
jgi:hypothetical protein